MLYFFLHLLHRLFKTGNVFAPEQVHRCHFQDVLNFSNVEKLFSYKIKIFSINFSIKATCINGIRSTSLIFIKFIGKI